MPTNEEMLDIAANLRDIADTIEDGWRIAVLPHNYMTGIESLSVTKELFKKIADIIEEKHRRESETFVRNSRCVHYEFCNSYNFDIDCNCPEFKRLDEETDRDSLLRLSDRLFDIAKEANDARKMIHPVIVMAAADGIREGCGVKDDAD